MHTRDEIAQANGQLWEKLVKVGCGYTVPWPDLDRDLLRRYAAGELENVPERLTCVYPPALFANVAGKGALCLASGGGQQSAAYGLLSAHVTVADLAQGQLDGDRKAAEHYGYAITTLQADMRDLSGLPAESFDLVYKGESLSYVPDVAQVCAEVARVLSAGGAYRVPFCQPAVFNVEWNGAAYCITRPYADKTYRREDGGIEFRHDMSDIFNGLLAAGFSIERVYEAPYPQTNRILARPCTWDHQTAYVGGNSLSSPGVLGIGAATIGTRQSGVL